MDRTDDDAPKKEKICIEKKKDGKDDDDDTHKQHYLIETPTGSNIDVEAQTRNKETYKQVDTIIAALVVILVVLAILMFGFK